MTDFSEQIKKARDIVGTLSSDDPDLVEILGNETDIFKMIEWVVKKYGEECALCNGITEYSEKIEKRIESSRVKQESLRHLAYTLMQAAGQKKYKTPAGTISIKAVAPKKLIQNEDEVPELFWKNTRTIDKAAINEYEGEIPGVTLSNGGETIQIRIN